MVNKKYTEEDLDNGVFMGMLIGFLFTAFFGLMILNASGAFDSPMHELDLDKDALAESHVIKYYPEYENCSFRYKESNKIDCENYIPGVEVLCGQIEDRDGMNVLENNPTLTLCFDEITLEEIFQEVVSDYK